MRTAEWIQAGFASIVALAAWIFPLAVRRRWIITVLALGALVCVAGARASEYVLGPAGALIFRDWVPVAITLIPYWQTGQFFVGPNDRIQAWLAASDRWFFGWFSRTGWRFGRAARLSMEWAYMLCYPIVPAGVAVLYVAGLRRYVDAYWFLVLAPTYICYAITPFFPALPPRSLGMGSTTQQTNKSRKFNLWILQHGSIQAISFPSAHVASALGSSLLLLRYVPLAGAVFLAITFWIAVAAVVEGYHYTVDVVLGAMVALVIYFVWRADWIPSTFLTTPAITLVAPL